MEEGSPAGMREDWRLLVSFLPGNWRELAASTGALKGLRKDKSAENLLRVLLMHLGCGHSLRETVVRARQAELAELSSVALWKRLKKSQDWLQALCIELFRERGVELAAGGGFEVRAVDATTVKEPGKSGSLWRIHYSVRLPSLACDYFKLTETEGPGTGESLRQFPIGEGDYLLADRGYSTAAGIGYVAQAGGRVTVRVNTGTLGFQTPEGQPFDLLAKVSELKSGGCPAVVAGAGGRPAGGPGVWPGLRDPQDRGGDPDRPGGHSQGGSAQGPAGAAANPGIRPLRDAVHDLPGDGIRLRGGAGVVPHPVAGRVGVQAVQVPGAARASAQARRRERQGLVVRQAARGAAGGETDRARDRRFPLGIPLGGTVGRTALGVTSSSRCIKSHAPSNRTGHWLG